MMFSNSGSTQTSYCTLSSQLLQDPEQFQKSQETCFSQASRTSKTNILVILDAQVEDWEKLQKGVVPQAKVILLDRTEDGIEQITQALRKYTDLSEIHIISHGSPGCLQLGNTQLSLDTLKRYASQLQTWSVPSLILYGCHVAAGDAGVEFIEKLHQITGAKIAASANKTGDSALGGDWNLEVKTDEFQVSLALTSEAIAHYPFTLPLGINSLGITEENIPDPPAADQTYVAPDITGTQITYKFQQGEPNLRIVNSFVGEDNAEFLAGSILNDFELRRADNANIQGNRQLLWFERDSQTAAELNLRPPLPTNIPSGEELMEVALFDDVINRGTDNIFANTTTQSDQNINNIERVDYIATNGLTTSNTASDLDSVGFLILERGGNDPFKIAPILALDNGVPSVYGELVLIAENEWGEDQSFTLNTSVLRSDNSDGSLQRSADVDGQSVGGVYVSYTDLGVLAGETFFGYSLFANDVNGTPDQLVDFTNAAVFPTNTNEADGGLDLIAGGVVYSKVLVSISDATAVNEGEDATFTVSLQRETATNVTVEYTTRDGTATANEDYTPIPTGTITILAGEIEATIPVKTLPDQIEEPDETFSVILTSTNQGFIGDTEGIGTIIDVPPTTANQPPVANNATATTRFGVPTDPIPLQITDPNENEDLTTIDLVPDTDEIETTRQIIDEQGQIQGTFELQPLVENQPPNVIFTPAPGFPGQADPITITYTVADKLDAVSDPPGTIAVTVTPNQPPTVFDVARDDRIPNNSNPIPLPLIEGTDFFDDDEIVSITFTLPPAEQGVLLLNGEEVTDPAQLENLPIDQLGNVTFQPNPEFTDEGENVNVRFTYTVTDNDGASSTANITIPINQAPIAEDAEARTRIGIEVPVNLVVSDPDLDGEVDLNTIDLNLDEPGIQPTFTVRGQGTFRVVENQPSVLFTPVPEFTDEFTGGIVTIPYTIQDNLGATSAPANISVRVNQLPVADDVITDSTLNVSPVAIPLSTANFRDPDPDGTVETISFTLPTPAQGLLLLDGVAVTDATQVQDLTLDQLDNLTFQPNLAFAGNASFSYTVTDNDGDISNVANITIPIVPLSVPSFPDPVNLPPQAQDKTETITNDGSASNLPQLIATDPDGTVEFLTIVELPPNGILFLNGEEITSLDQVSRLTAEQAGQLSFQPDPNFIGEASFTFTATDNDGAVSNIATVRLNVEEDAVFPPNQPVDDGGCDCPPLPEFAGIDLPNRPSVIPNPSNVEQPIIGSATEDTLRGTLTDDEILASLETAVIIGFEGNDSVFGTTGDLLIFGDEGSDSLFGDFGNDTIIGTNGAGSGISVGDVLEQDILYGNEGNDILQGGPGNDTIFSGEQDDFTFGGQDNDIILGDLGNDTLYGDQGDDSMLGDTVDEEEIEPERGLNGVLDLMWGGAGDDSMNGGRGNDTLSGGDGNDDVRGGKEDDLVYGEAGDDLLYGDLGNDHLCGDEGNDTIYGDINDNVNFADTPGQDTLCGGIGNDLMFGNQDNDRLCGGEDSDTLYGGLGEDTLYGELGDDWLFGDEGNDLLFGGSGSDRFLIFSNEGIDTIGDFQLGTDFIALGGGLTFDQLTFTQEGTSTILSLDGQQLAILNNIQVSALTESSFTALVN
ncbi:DUF4347 domain-containing protein [Limnoraphis robusta Tam1]|uniref:DUF4347 domain-containing protein n=1 Tax=Limnoraphis robusta TaxID=1118279 RepID=UPI002B1F3E1E|nr:DUF4347 domain-containing protein [Limnoraphis robusta]MEA5542108.1 DUF4347 domain-containing protein [Limnoraphis robusta Tam1]